MDKLQELRARGINIVYPDRKFKTWCPRCADRKLHKRDKDLSVDPVQGVWNCHSPNCDFKGAVRLTEYKRPTIEAQAPMINHGKNYLIKERGLSERTLDFLKIYTSDKEIRYRYFKNDVYVNYKSRGITEKKFSQSPDAEHVVYNHDSLHGKTKAIFTEGETDVATWVELGFSDEWAIISLDNGASEEGKSVEGKFKCLEGSAFELNKITHFVLAGDNDSPGRYTMEKLAERLGKHRCSKIDWSEYKDTNQAYTELLKMGDSKEVISKLFQKMLDKAEPFPVGGITMLDDNMISEILEELENGEIRGTKITAGGFTELYSVYESELTLFTGYPGDGKSTFARNLAMMYAVEHDWKFACYVPEDNPAKFFYKDMIKIYLGAQIDQTLVKHASKQDVLIASDFIRTHFFYIHPEPDDIGQIVIANNSWINNKIAYLKIKFGVTCFIKDPWNKIYHDISSAGGREDHYLQHEFQREDAFCKQYRACWYVAHPNKPTRVKGEGIPMPTQYDISGGAMWNNAMYNIICVWRPERGIDEHSKRTKITTLKVRKGKLVGREGSVMLLYDKTKHRYYYEDGTMFWINNDAKINKAMHPDLDEDIPF